MKKYISNKILLVVVGVIAIVAGFVGFTKARAATAVNLATADNFAVLAGSGITDTTPSVIIGDVGLSPTTGAAIVGLTTGEVTGFIYAVDAFGPIGSQNNPGLLTNAKNDLTTAYTNAAGQVPTGAIIANLGGQTLAPGVYNTASSISLTGTVTLNGGGDPSAVFIFQAGSTLTTASASHVALTNGTQACNVFWQVGSSATLGTTSDFQGNILAFSAITDNGGSVVNGRLLAENAAVTLNNTTVTKSTCAGALPGTLHVIKHVVNDNGGSNIAADFTVTVAGTTNITPSSFAGSEAGVDVSMDAGSYTVTETGPTGYAESDSIDCSGTMTAGGDKTCTITNDDQATHLIVIKHVINNGIGTKVASDFTTTIGGVTTAIPSAAGAEAPGVDNILTSVGAYSVVEGVHAGYNRSLSVDCTGSIAFGETKTCTITNRDIGPATGGGSSTMTISPTTPPVAPAVQVFPQIAIAKVPTPATLIGGPGSVTFDYTVWNTAGPQALANVMVTDDKCTALVFVSGDVNNNAKLDLHENWKYSCNSFLSKTTTNTATAIGYSDDSYHHATTAFAVRTVSVFIPGLPKTGFAPEQKNSSTDLMVITLGMLSILAIYGIQKKYAVKR